MKILQLTALGLVGWWGLAVSMAAGHGYGYGPRFGCGPRVGWTVGVHLGGPPCYRPWYPPPVWYYRPYPVIVEAPPQVIVQPAPTIVQPAPTIVQPAPTAIPAPAPTRSSSSPLVPVATQNGQADSVDYFLQQLTRNEESIRRQAVVELGRLKAERAVDPLCATLAGDGSPVVREAAAQALAIIASVHSLPALTRAAQADSDRDVRRTAQFAIEIIHANLRRN